ncbi:hypothetical protein J6352_10870 [Burkholderia pseudomallei]|uniref:hypothetical protein n=1 Tax=Burkholderia pseudomallei TaxID=28450 RepID=UPI001AD6FFEF|nr:hypothetical protein [Burkholderia pseudomallei]MBO7773435.1 hypothetical protein [Burkholderia pseudomallei]MBO7905882.1 hypothetical protein [Burkholderia pseudomallei]
MPGASELIKPKTTGGSTPEAVINALRNRCSWPHLRAALKKANLPAGTGWAEVGGAAEDKQGNGPKLRKFLSDYHWEHVIAGERYVHLYDLPSDSKAKLVATLTAATVLPSAFSSTYPLPLASKDLLSAPSDPTLVEVRDLTGGDYALVYCSVRSYDEREKYEFSQLPSHVQQTYKEIDELITVKKIHFQAYDVAVIRPGLDRIEICIDQPSRSSHSYLGTLVLSVFGTMCNNLPMLQEAYEGEPYNVFPAIAGIYFTKNEGTVRSLSFRTLTGSRKHEKMIKSDDDLRSEAFHHAGAQAVKNKLKPYELTVDWDSTIPVGNVEVAMNALIREISSPSPRLEGFYVTADANPLIAVGINKVVKYL